ncbi:MAG TPA: right-handed parallel beta-helix repeat-containing protein, partial [bacterium]|nr:right-handed parallel beta-helix repeat-containing protein [bacterium]
CSSRATVLGQVTTGDTVYIDAGTYSGNWTITDVVGIVLQGADSSATVLQVSGAADRLTLTGCTGCVIADLRVTGAPSGYSGIVLNGSPQATLQNATVSGNDMAGIRLYNYSLSASISNCAVDSNSSYGIYIESSSEVMVYGTAIRSNVNGVYGVSSSLLTVEDCLIDSSIAYGVYLPTGCDSAMLAGNRITRNGSTGVYGVPYALLTDNVVTGNVSGIVADIGAQLRGNLVAANSAYGLSVTGMYVQASLNEFGGNGTAAVGLQGGATNSNVHHNNFTAGDTLVICDVMMATPMLRNYWGTADSAAIAARIGGSYSWNVQYQPYRFYPVDTAPGADTIAPATPDTITAAGVDTGTVHISWAAVLDNEDSGGPCGDLDGYSLLRRQQGDIAWAELTSIGAGTEEYADASVSSGVLYWYAVAAYDSKAPYVNESWLSGAVSAMALIDTSGANAWYVNDGAMAGDRFTSTIGVFANPGTSPDSPAISIGSILPYVSPGDTIFIDAGTYSETFTIPCDSLAIIGASETLTVIMASGTDTGIYALNRSGLLLSGLEVEAAASGVYWQGVTGSRLEHVATNGCGSGMVLEHGDNNTI